MNNKKQPTQKPISIKQLVEATKATEPKKGEAIISIIKQANESVHLKWAGTNKDLLDSAFTLLQNDVHIAAVICRASKDYLDSLKDSPQRWMELTQEVAKYDAFTRTANSADSTPEGRKEDEG